MEPRNNIYCLLFRVRPILVTWAGIAGAGFMGCWIRGGWICEGGVRRGEIRGGQVRVGWIFRSWVRQGWVHRGGYRGCSGIAGIARRDSRSRLRVSCIAFHELTVAPLPALAEGKTFLKRFLGALLCYIAYWILKCVTMRFTMSESESRHGVSSTPVRCSVLKQALGKRIR
jgi:hypothetical protein